MKQRGERQAFALAFGRLALAHHIELDQPTMEVYWESLSDVPIQQLVPALTHLTRHAAGFFPKPGEIRKVVDALPPPPVMALSHGSGEFCDRCEDTCWVAGPDGRSTRCTCFPDNPVYQASHKFTRRKYFNGEDDAR